MIWVFIALMTAAAVMAVLWPLARRGGAARQASDVAVYTDQLDEIERDQRFGLIAPPEADAARIEVSRRLIAAADAAAVAAKQKPSAAASPMRRRVVALIGLIALPAVALAVYLDIGSPQLPGAPLAQRIAQARAGQRSVEEMFAEVERHLADHPDDGRGWELVAPIYMRLGRFDDAAKAWRNVLRTLGPTPERWSALGEVLVARGNGIVTDEAKAAFDSALKIDPKDITARFYSGLAAEQDGRPADAAAIWRALAADAPPNAGWLPTVQRALARVDPASASALANAAPSAPPNAMIAAMVAQLDARLHQDGSDVDGWIKLVRSYVVLHQPDKAKATEADARKALANDPDKLARLEAGLKAIAAGAPPPASEPPAASNAAPPPPAANEPNAQNEMIRNMVARLDARLHQDGADVDGWIKLMNSYLVLGEPDKARATLRDARNALKDDPAKLRQLDEGAKNLGVGG